MESLVNNEIECRDASELATEHYTEYSKYVNTTRAVASIFDGLKTVQRRIIYQANKLPNKLIKSASIVGDAIKLHPHGDGSIYGSIVAMAHPGTNLKLFDTQGNFGGPGFPAAASRYTECKLSDVARFIYCQFIDYAPMEVGEIGLMEPTYLPCLLPYGLIEGTSGIGVGLSSDSVPMNIMDVVDYYIDYIKNGEFNNNKIPKPDFGSSIINLNYEDCAKEISHYKGGFPIHSVINRESDKIFVIETLYGMNIDKVLKKLGKYIDTDKVDFRNETKTTERYVFEIVDNSVDPKDFYKDLERATSKRISFSRVYDVNQKSVYCSLNYVIEKQLLALNKAIDLKIETELNNYLKKSELLRALKFFKNTGIFNNLSSKLTSDVINEMLTYKEELKKLNIDITENLANDILKKPISYLTKSHENEIEDIENNIELLRNHDRKEYLIDLYTKLKGMLKPRFDMQKHSLLSSQVLNNPKARLGISGDSQTIEIVQRGKGCHFDKFLFLASSEGSIYRRAISAVTATAIDIDTGNNDTVVGIISDYDRYIEFITNDNEGVCFDTNNYRYDKAVVNLREGQKVVRVNGYTDKNIPDNVKRIIRTKISRTVRY